MAAWVIWEHTWHFSLPYNPPKTFHCRWNRTQTCYDAPQSSVWPCLCLFLPQTGPTSACQMSRFGATPGLCQSVLLMASLSSHRCHFLGKAFLDHLWQRLLVVHPCPWKCNLLFLAGPITALLPLTSYDHVTKFWPMQFKQKYNVAVSSNHP